ncbi:unnamed protein product [Sphenostylis stenocarpa]|uniref:Uncharacterized protein n=1 Tax=Sphenostylis stenocarpa TaxID=92480 RepID=A0AA86VG38_9FABA|nr:unnamed protein product [Sphenostylis stenocarpa]
MTAGWAQVEQLQCFPAPHRKKHSHARVSKHARPFSFPGGPNRINGSQSHLASLVYYAAQHSKSAKPQ